MLTSGNAMDLGWSIPQKVITDRNCDSNRERCDRRGHTLPEHAEEPDNDD